jgi:tripartite-type tricarboxylate transporter receptor subunit TctC
MRERTTQSHRSSSIAAYCLSAAASLAPATAEAGAYPERHVSIIMQTAAGNGPDVIARIVGEYLGRAWKQQVVVINQPGGGGLVAARAAANATPDGYTLFMPVSSTYIVLPVAQPKMPIDLHRDFIPIGLIGKQPMIIAAHRKLGVKTLPDLIALSKRGGTDILYGANPGTFPHLTGMALQDRTGASLRFVPYTSNAAPVQDALGGTLSLVIEALPSVAGAMDVGTLNGLAVASAMRLPNFPDLPTVAEALPGIGAFEAQGWFVLAAPAKTPADILEKLGADLRAVLLLPELKSRFNKVGTVAHPLGSTETTEFIRREQEHWLPMVKKVGLAPQ